MLLKSPAATPQNKPAVYLSAKRIISWFAIQVFWVGCVAYTPLGAVGLPSNAYIATEYINDKSR